MAASSSPASGDARLSLPSALLCCAACGGSLETAILLPCVHSLCRFCFDRLQPATAGSEGSSGAVGEGGSGKPKQVECPSCGCVGAARPNAFLAAAVGVDAGASPVPPPQLLCDTCKNLPVTCRCTECNKVMCAGCRRWHDKFNKTHAGAVVAAGDVGSADGKVNAVPVAARLALPTCTSAEAHGSSSSLDATAATPPTCDSFCSTCAVPLCAACRRACERDRHDVTVATTGVATSRGSDDIGLAAEKIADLARKSLATTLGALSSSSAALAERLAMLPSSSAGSQSAEAVGSDSAAIAAASIEALKADLRRLDANESTVISAVRQAFARARKAIERDHAADQATAQRRAAAGAITSSSSVVAASARRRSLEERTGLLIAYGRALAASGGAADVLDQQPVVVARARMLLIEVESEVAAAAAVAGPEVGGREVALARSHVAAIDGSVELAEAVADHTLRKWTGMLSPEAGDQHAQPAADDRFALHAQEELHLRQPPVREDATNAEPPASTAALAENLSEVRRRETRMDGTIGVTAADNATIAEARMVSDAAAVASSTTATRTVAAATDVATTAAGAGSVQSAQSPATAISSNAAAIPAAALEVEVTVAELHEGHQQRAPVSRSSSPVADELEASSERQSHEADSAIIAAAQVTGSVTSAAAPATAGASNDRIAADEGYFPAGGSDDGNGREESRQLLMLRTSADDWAMLTCCHCRGVLDEPVLLACLHSCCSRCLSDARAPDPADVDEKDDVARRGGSAAADAGQRSVTCAQCRTTTILPVTSDGAPDAKLNGFAAARVRAMHIAAGLAKCDLCVQAAGGRHAPGSGRSAPQQTTARDATHQCADCAKLLCDDCLRWHRRFNGGRHRVEQIAAAAAAAAAGQPAGQSGAAAYSVQCETHGSKRDLYCTVCERLKCIECAKLPCMEARHEIIVADKEGAAELLRSVANELRDKCGELARWHAAEREQVTPSDDASTVAVGADDRVSGTGEDVRQLPPGHSPTELATMALERSTEAVSAAYVLLGERAEESAKRAVVLTQEARRAAAYCSALLACAPPLVAVDHLPVVTQRLKQLLAEVDARLAVTPDSVEPSAFSLVERPGEPRKVLTMAASASAAPAAAGARSSGARPELHGSSSSSSSVKADAEAESQADGRRADDDPESEAAVSLRCARCSKDPADEPLLLPCLHGSCCRRCAGFSSFNRGGAESSSVVCLECGQTTAATSLRSSSLTLALARTAPIVTDEGETGFPACHTCLDAYRRTAARSLCADCGIFMCQSCRRHHDKFNVGHKVVPVDATVESRRQATEIVASAIIFCPEDNEKYDMYCRTCDRLRCYNCTKRCLNDKHSVTSDLGEPATSRRDATLRTDLVSLSDRLQNRAALLAERANAAAKALLSGRAREADLNNLRSVGQHLASSLAGRAGPPAAAVRAPVAVAGQRRQLRERVRHAIHYSRSLLAFAEATAAAGCCLLEQHADVLRCVRQLLDEVQALQVASAAAASTTHSSGAAGWSDSSPHVGGVEDVIARYQQEIGIVREDADDILSEPKASPADVDVSPKAVDMTEAGSSIGSGASVNSQSSATGSSVDSTGTSGRVGSDISGGSYGGGSSSSISGDRVSAGSRSSSAKRNRAGRQDDGGRGGESATSSIENVIINDIQDDDNDDSPSDSESLALVTDAEAAEAGIIGGSSFDVGKEARDVAITSDGRVLVAILWGGIAEYDCASGQLLSSWKPPQFEEGADCASAVDVLEDGIVVVGLIGSQSVALLRRQRHRDDDDAKTGGDRSDDEEDASASPWNVESSYILPVAPWGVSGRSGVLAAIGAVEVASDSGRSWRSGPYLCLTRRADGHTLLTHTLAYSAESVALTGLNSVVVLSSEEHPLDGGRRLAHVAEAFDFDGVPLWYTESGGAGDVCASPSGGTLYLALPKEHRVRSIAAADGRSEGDALTRHDRGLRQPSRVAMASAGEGASGGGSSFAAIAVLIAGDDVRKVFVYPARMSHGDL